jgi:hypothetical protein
MLVWMLYVVVVSGFLCLAALAAERAQRLLRGATRWVWASGIAASLVVPAIIASVSIQLPEIPSIVGAPAAARVVALREQTSAKLTPSSWFGAGARDLASRPVLEISLRRAWWVASAAVLATLLSGGAHLHWRKRHWDRGVMAGFPVFFTDDVGPAVVGLVRPQIAVPDWLRNAPAPTQQLVMAHERAHLEARDVQVFAVSLLFLVCTPWNPLLWWQLRRLRRAIEVDCDARVLAAGRDAAHYGETLLAVGQRQSAYIGAVAGMSESTSFLEERIRFMVSKRPKRWRLSAAALAGLACSLLAAAAEVGPPNGRGEQAAPELATSVLDRYVGFYKLGENAVFAVTRQGNQLSAQLTGQPAAPIYPESATRFFYKVVKAQIDFVADSAGNVSALVLHQDGADLTAPRIEKAAAQQIDGSLAARIKAQTPEPGSEAAVRSLLAGEASGKPDYDRMSPELAAAVRQQLPTIRASLATLGPVLSVEFVGVGAQGWDNYLVKHAHGVSQVRITLNDKGIIVGAYHSNGP